MNDNKVLLLSNQDTYYRPYTKKFNYVNQINLIAGQNKYYLDNGAGNNLFLMDKAVVGLSIYYNTAAETNSVLEYPLAKLNVLSNAFLWIICNAVNTVQGDRLARYAIQNPTSGSLPYVQLAIPKGLDMQTSYVLLNNLGVTNIVANSCIEFNWEYLDFKPGTSDPV